MEELKKCGMWLCVEANFPVTRNMNVFVVSPVLIFWRFKMCRIKSFHFRRIPDVFWQPALATE